MLRTHSHDDRRHALETRRAELLRDLIAAQDRFPSLFAERRDAVVLFDCTGLLVRANRSALDFLGVDLPVISERRYTRLTDPLQRTDARAVFAAALGGASAATTARLQIAGGHVCAVEMTLCPAMAGNEIAGVYATARHPAVDPSTARRMQTLASLFGNHGDAVFALDESGTVIDANAACERLTGYPVDRLCDRSYASLLAPDARIAAYDVFDRALKGEAVNAATAIVHRDGNRIELAGMSVPIVVDGRTIGVYAIGRDVTEQSRLTTALREQTERIRELYLVAASTGQSADAQIATALERAGKRLGCDGGFVARVEDGIVTYLHVTGDAGVSVGSSHPLARTLHRFVLEARRPVAVDDAAFGAVRAFIGTPISVGGLEFGTLCLVQREPRAQPFTEADRDFIRLVGALAASSIERGVQRRRLDALAFYDQLTQLPNRTLLGDRLHQAIASAERHGTAFALHYYDLDGFKTINDSHGHMSGDDVLRTVARRFERVARAEDTVARIGGDEFVVLQPFVRSRADVETLTARLRAALGEPIAIEGIEYRLTASAGVALYPDDGREAATLLARADAALYRVKGDGRDNVAFASPPPQPSA